MGERQVVTLKPMLAQEASVDQLDAFCDDDAWVMQPKFDGHRCLVVVTDEVKVFNRAGDPRAHRFDRRSFEALIGCDVALDGEVMGDTFIVFDLPRLADKVDRSTPYWSDDPDAPGRYQLLEALFGVWSPDPAKVRLAPVARTADDKRRLVKAVWDGGREGVMVKAKAGIYQPGVRSRHMVKVKHTKTVDAFALRIGDDGHNSVTLAVLDPSKPTVAEAVVEIGKASLVGKELWGIRVGSVVTATYLSFFPEDRRLVQCRLTALRDDKPYDQCLISQLVFSSKEGLEW